MTQGFVTTFEFLLTEQDSFRRYKGADGFAFVVQNESATAIGNQGGAAAFAGGDGITLRQMPGISRSLAVFFDTHKNADVGDPSGNYVAVCSTVDAQGGMQWPPRCLARTNRLKVRLKDGKCHSVRILYRPGILFVFLDDMAVPILNVSVYLDGIVGNQGSAFVGFTAATGSGYQNHIIRSWSFACGYQADATSAISVVDSSISFLRAACLPDRPLCTPDQAIIEDRGPGRYHIVLPANLEWGAGIPNPQSAVIHVENAAGVVCLEQKRGDSPACNGPTGNGSIQERNVHILRDLLAPESPLGALIWKTRRGWTYFSINDRSGNPFLDNEGYFNFEVQIVGPRQ